MEHIFIRGSRVRFVIVPDMLKNAPMVSALHCDCTVQHSGVLHAKFCVPGGSLQGCIYLHGQGMAGGWRWRPRKRCFWPSARCLQCSLFALFSVSH